MDIENGINVHENEEVLVSEQEVTNEVQSNDVVEVSNQVTVEELTPAVTQQEVETTVAEIVSDEAVGEETKASIMQNEGETVAEESEEEHEMAEEEADYSQLSPSQLLELSEELFKESSFRKIDNSLRLLKMEIDRINREEKDAQLKKFTEAGGEEDGFQYKQDEIIEKFYANYKALKEKKSKYFNEQEKKKHRNLETKQEIVKQIKQIVEAGDTSKQAIDSLKELQKRWKETGGVHPQEAEKLYETYNALLDRFYSQKNIENELIELDRKKNLEAKSEICRKAEGLLEIANINEAINQLNKLHEEYRSIGHVPREEQETLWQRFKLASDKLYDRKRSYVGDVKKRLEENMKLKQDLCLRIEGYPEFNSDRIADWNTKTKEVLALQEEWDKVGPAPREVAKDINKQFWSNFKTFFNNKSKFFERLEKQRDENLKHKISLCEQAEAAKESADWDETSDLLKRLQDEWKSVGPVPESQRDTIYERFKAACDEFFNRKRNRRSSQDQEFEVNLTKKKEICDNIEALTKAKDHDEAKFDELLDSWLNTGFVPRKAMNSIQDRLTKVIDNYIDSLGLNAEDTEKEKFGVQMKLMGNNPNSDRKMFRKEQAIRKKLTTLENDIALWRNNLEFFAHSKTADKLRADFNSKIEEASKEVESLKTQLKVLQNL
jgi:hypothetical protein